MQQIITTVYNYDELEPKAQERARQWFYEACATDEWWQSVYEDAERVGIKITSFDTGRSEEIELEFITSHFDTMHAIYKEHGPECDTFKAAREYEDSIDQIPEMLPEGEPGYDEREREICETADALEGDFLDALGKCYLRMLRDELAHQSSEEFLSEGIIANEYTFTKEGKRFG